MKISFSGTRIMSVERNSAGPAGIRTEDTGSGLCIVWFIVKLSYCTYIFQHIFSAFFPPQVIQEKLLFCICERPSCSRSPTCTFSSSLHPDLLYFWRFIRSQCGWKRGKTCLVEKKSIKSFYQACIHVFLSYVANATMEETYVPPDWWRWGNFEAWWR